MTALFLLSALGCNVFLAFADKYTSKFLQNNGQVWFFSFCKTLACALLAACILPFSDPSIINTAGVLIAVFAGLFHAASVVFIMLSLKRSDAVYVNLLMAAGVVFPSLFGWILWGQELTVLKICALALLILSLFMTLRGKGGGRFHFPTAAVTFLFYGMLMVAQGAFPRYCEGGSGVLFSVIMYATSSLILGVVSAVKCREKIFFPKGLSGLCLASAGANLIINLLLTLLSSLTDAVVTFPVVHGGKLVAVTLLSGLVWGEKLGAMRIVFAFLSIGCIVLLSI